MIDYTLILDLKYKGFIWGLNANDPNQLIWNEKNNIPKPTKEELDSQWEEVLSIKKKQECKDQAKLLIAKYDFAVLPDRSKDIQNIDEIIAYRDALLDLIKNPIENPIFPDKPQTIWKESI